MTPTAVARLEMYRQRLLAEAHERSPLSDALAPLAVELVGHHARELVRIEEKGRGGAVGEFTEIRNAAGCWMLYELAKGLRLAGVGPGDLRMKQVIAYLQVMLGCRRCRPRSHDRLPWLRLADPRDLPPV